MASGKNAGSRKSKAGTSGKDAEQQANSLGDELESAATEAGENVQEAAGELTQTLRQQITSQVTAQQERAVDTLDTVALLLHQAGEHAHREDKATIAQYTDQASEQVERLSNAVRDRQADQLLSETKQLAQKQPGWFVGGALLAGFLGARFLRSSAQPPSADSEQEQSGPDQAPGGTGTAQTGAYGSDVAGAGPYGVGATTAADVSRDATPGPTDATGLEGTLLEEDVAALHELEQESLRRPGAERINDTGPDTGLGPDGDVETP